MTDAWDLPSGPTGMNAARNGLFHLAVIVSALGFFVDVYDLLLFSIVRKPSLLALGLNADAVLHVGERIIGLQMVGLLLGGILWGVLGDRYGRRRVLFCSILLYSAATLLNAAVHTPGQYAWLRFIAGIGLAGELGAGVTLVSELLPPQRRGLGAAFVAAFGVLGAITAFSMNALFAWRACYAIGGCMGLVLLLMRTSLRESPLFQRMQDAGVPRGNFLLFFTRRDRFMRYLRCILIGIPTWYVIGVLITFADKFAEAFGVDDIDPGKAVVYQYAGLLLGDLCVGLLGQWWRSRKKPLFLFYGITALCCTLFFLQDHTSALRFYLLCMGMGFGTGFTVVYITMSAEQFGTNLRATAAITVPNMVRGALPLILLLFQVLRDAVHDYALGGAITGAVLLLIAVLAAWGMEETFGKPLDRLET